jgi:hypothetical protein
LLQIPRNSIFVEIPEIPFLFLNIEIPEIPRNSVLFEIPRNSQKFLETPRNF